MNCLWLQHPNGNETLADVRVAAGLGLRELAVLADVSPNTISRLERGEELKQATKEIIRSALESAGVEFIAENGGGPGVRLRK